LKRKGVVGVLCWMIVITTKWKPCCWPINDFLLCVMVTTRPTVSTTDRPTSQTTQRIPGYDENHLRQPFVLNILIEMITTQQWPPSAFRVKYFNWNDYNQKVAWHAYRPPDRPTRGLSG
jgi:hypothetical protein